VVVVRVGLVVRLFGVASRWGVLVVRVLRVQLVLRVQVGVVGARRRTVQRVGVRAERVRVRVRVGAARQSDWRVATICGLLAQTQLLILGPTLVLRLLALLRRAPVLLLAQLRQRGPQRVACGRLRGHAHIAVRLAGRLEGRPWVRRVALFEEVATCCCGCASNATVQVLQMKLVLFVGEGARNELAALLAGRGAQFAGRSTELLGWFRVPFLVQCQVV